MCPLIGTVKRSIANTLPFGTVFHWSAANAPQWLYKEYGYEISSDNNGWHFSPSGETAGATGHGLIMKERLNIAHNDQSVPSRIPPANRKTRINSPRSDRGDGAGHGVIERRGFWVRQRSESKTISSVVIYRALPPVVQHFGRHFRSITDENIERGRRYVSTLENQYWRRMWIESKPERYGADTEGDLMEQQAKKLMPILPRLNCADGAETLGWKRRKEEPNEDFWL